MTEPIGNDGAPLGDDRFAHLNSPSVWDSTRFGFSQAVVSPPGRIAWVSGQVGWDTDRQMIDPTLAGQVRNALENLARILVGVGGTLAEVTSLRIYVVADFDEELEEIDDALNRHVERGRGPATTWIRVAGLVRPELKVEIEATAVLPEPPPDP